MVPTRYHPLATDIVSNFMVVQIGYDVSTTKVGYIRRPPPPLLNFTITSLFLAALLKRSLRPLLLIAVLSQIPRSPGCLGHSIVRTALDRTLHHVLHLWCKNTSTSAYYSMLSTHPMARREEYGPNLDSMFSLLYKGLLAVGESATDTSITYPAEFLHKWDSSIGANVGRPWVSRQSLARPRRDRLASVEHAPEVPWPRSVIT